MGIELTCREKDVLGLLVQGCSNKKIAMSLCISDFTVRDHVYRCFLNMEWRTACG